MTHPPLTDALHTLGTLLRDAALGAKTLDDALVLARLMGRLHWDNISGHFSDDPFEQALHDRWNSQITAQAQRSKPLLPETDILHIATQLYEGGGHSRLMHNLATGLSAAQAHQTSLSAAPASQALLLTGQKRGQPNTGTLPHQHTTGRGAKALAQIIATARQAKTVLLHIHPDDATTALAARVLQAEGRHILFVNHADHVFSFGPGAANAVLEICATGWKTTRDRRAARAQSFMGIPIVSAGESPAPRAATPNRDGPIVSMGGPGKFRPFQSLSFPDFLAGLLPNVPNDVILIGPSPSDPWWSEICAAFPNRISLRGPLPPAQVTDILKTASCYIDSFPLDGGTAFPQSVFQGPPGFGPNASDAPGVSPADALRLPSVPALIEAVTAYLNGGAYPFDLDTVRHQIQQSFSDQAVAQRVLGAIQGQYAPLPQDLATAGQRDSDYNARRWAAAGQLHLPKRIWRHLSLGARRDVLRRLRMAPLPQDSLRTLKRRAILG